MVLRRFVLGFCAISALLGCSSDKASTSESEKVPRVFIEAVFTTEPNSLQGVARPQDRQPLAQVDVACDGRLGVRLAYEEWQPRAPGLCGATVNCGHGVLTLTQGDRTASVGVVATPALLTLPTPELWTGDAQLVVELRNDDDSPHLASGAPVRDQLDLPLAARDCAAGAAGGAGSSDSAGAGGANP